MGRLAMLASLCVLGGLAVSCAKSSCDASTCRGACCDGDVCRTEFTNETCATDGAACVACNTAVSWCHPATRSCERFAVVSLSWTAVSETQPQCPPISCTADARVWEADYPAMAASPDYAGCSQFLAQAPDATHPAIWAWSSCVPCTDPCCAPPLDASPVAPTQEDCRFHPSYSCCGTP